jgi:hypothetical protein
MKSLFLVAVLACLILPAASLAQDNNDNNNDGNNNINAIEMTGIGMSTATLLGGVAYLRLRGLRKSK